MSWVLFWAVGIEWTTGWTEVSVFMFQQQQKEEEVGWEG